MTAVELSAEGVFGQHRPTLLLELSNVSFTIPSSPTHVLFECTIVPPIKRTLPRVLKPTHALEDLSLTVLNVHVVRSLGGLVPLRCSSPRGTRPSLEPGLPASSTRWDRERNHTLLVVADGVVLAVW